MMEIARYYEIPQKRIINAIAQGWLKPAGYRQRDALDKAPLTVFSKTSIERFLAANPGGIKSYTKATPRTQSNIDSTFYRRREDLTYEKRLADLQGKDLW